MNDDDFFINQEEIGSIIVADDQMINLEALKMTFAQIGISTNVKYCHDGAFALETALKMAKDAINNSNNFPVRPISLMLLDF